MSSVHQSAVARLTKARAGLEDDKSDLRKSMARLTKQIGTLRQDILRTKSESMRRSKERQLASKEDYYARSQKKLADIEKKLASTGQELDRHLQALSREQERTDKSRHQDEIRHVRAVTREMERQAALQAHIGANPMVIDLMKLPTQITVLFLAANPQDQSSLRLDEENRTIVEKIRASEHRDAIKLISRWAVRPGDLQQALNEHQPHIVHFSGHGNQDSIVFQNADGTTKPVSKPAIAATLSTGGDNVRVVLFNSCFSQGQAEAVTEHIEVAIGMNDSIGDEAARIFAGQFYSAIGFGRSVKNAFDQAINELRLHGIPEDLTPELHARDGVDPDAIFLVRPSEFPT